MFVETLHIMVAQLNHCLKDFKTINGYIKKWARNEGYEYCASFPLFDLGEPQILLVEDAPNLTKNELHNLEYQYIANNDNINIHGKMKSDIHQCHVDFKKKYPDKRIGDIRVIYEDIANYRVVVE